LSGSDRDEICVYSNGPDVVFYLADIKCVRNAAIKRPYYHEIQVDTREKVIAEIKGNTQKVLFVWLNEVRTGRFFNIEYLKDNFDIISLSESDDGNVYEIVVNK